MLSIESLIAAIRTTIDQTRILLAGLAASKDLTEDLRSQLHNLGTENKAAEAGAIVTNLEERQAQTKSLADRLEAALTAAEAARGNAGGAGGGKSPTLPSAPPGQPRGWDAAPDLEAARDKMPRLGEVPGPRQVHILDGDGNGRSGGHLWDSEIPGKTKFPRDWDDARIIAAISDVARNPDRTPVSRDEGGWLCLGTRDQVEIRAVINRDGSIWTGHPLSGPGVETNPF